MAPTSTTPLAIDDELARALAAAKAALDPISDGELRRKEIQTALLEHYRSVCGPALDNLVAQLHEQLGRWPFFVRVSGLRVHNPDALLVALSRTLGVCVEPYEEEWARLVRHIEARRERLTHGGMPLNEFLHTDGTDWPVPNDYTCLLCVRPDQRGQGGSLLLGVGEAEHEVERRAGSRVMKVLRSERVPWKVADALGGGAVWEPVFGAERLRWLRYTVDLALDDLDVRLDERMTVALDAFGGALALSDCVHRFDLARGDLLVIDNRRCLHGRTAIGHPQDSERLLVRTKVAIR